MVARKPGFSIALLLAFATANNALATTLLLGPSENLRFAQDKAMVGNLAGAADRCAGTDLCAATVQFATKSNGVLSVSGEVDVAAAELKALETTRLASIKVIASGTAEIGTMQKTKAASQLSIDTAAAAIAGFGASKAANQAALASATAALTTIGDGLAAAVKTSAGANADIKSFESARAIAAAALVAKTAELATLNADRTKSAAIVVAVNKQVASVDALALADNKYIAAKNAVIADNTVLKAAALSAIDVATAQIKVLEAKLHPTAGEQAQLKAYKADVASKTASIRSLDSAATAAATAIAVKNADLGKLATQRAAYLGSIAAATDKMNVIDGQKVSVNAAIKAGNDAVATLDSQKAAATALVASTAIDMKTLTAQQTLTANLVKARATDIASLDNKIGSASAANAVKIAANAALDVKLAAAVTALDAKNAALAALEQQKRDLQQNGHLVAGVVIQDMAPKNGGLGVFTPTLGGGDNIDAGERLTLNFAQATRIGNLTFYNDSHGTTFSSNATWQMILGDGAIGTYALNSLFDPKMSFLSDSFTFVGLKGSDSFYVGAMTAQTATTVPEPGTWALLLGALTMMGFARRQQQGGRGRA